MGKQRKILEKLVCVAIVGLAVLSGAKEARATVVTTLYEFLPDQSTVIWHHGSTGWSIPHSIEGQFQLSVDFDASIASFDWVDAILTNGQPPSHHPDFNMNGLSLDELFNMTELFGTVVSDALIYFEGQTIEGPPLFDINLMLTFMDESVHLTGGFVQSVPDGWGYELDAVAVPEPATLLLLFLGGLVVRKRIFQYTKNNRRYV